MPNNNVRKLYEYSSIYRNAIELAKANGEFSNDVCFQNFPMGCCDDTSDLLAQFLLEKGYNTLNVCGTYLDSRGNYFDSRGSHAWLLYDDRIIIDITGDQFRYCDKLQNYDKKVYVGKCDDFHNLFEIDFRSYRQPYYFINETSNIAQRLSNLYSIINSYI